MNPNSFSTAPKPAESAHLSGQNIRSGNPLDSSPYLQGFKGDIIVESPKSPLTNLVPEVSKPKEVPASSFAIGAHQQQFMTFGPRLEDQIKTVQQVLHQFQESTSSEPVKPEAIMNTSGPKIKIDKEQLIEGALNHTVNVANRTYKEGKDIFGAIKSLWTQEIGFKVLSKEKQEQLNREKEKKAAQNANKKAFFNSLVNAKLQFENAIMKMIEELKARFGLAGKSNEEINALLGQKGRNFSFKDVNTPYHIAAVHEALLEREKQEKQKAKAATVQAPSKGKPNYFMDKNSAISRQGQSVYSAAG